MAGFFEFVVLIVGFTAIAITTNLAAVGLADLLCGYDSGSDVAEDAGLAAGSAQLADPKVGSCCKRKSIRRSRAGGGGRVTLKVIDLTEAGENDELDNRLETTLLSAIDK